MLTNKQLKTVFQKTEGHCHFCGDKLMLKRYASASSQGAWEIDHVIQKKKGGANTADNYLPACVRCNRLRWHRKGDELRGLIFLGLIAKDEMKKETEVGRQMAILYKKRSEANIKRRRARLCLVKQ